MTFIGIVLLWGFFGILVAILAAATLLSVLLPSVILRASCSVAEVKEPDFILSFPLGYGVVLLNAVLTGVIAFLFGKLDGDHNSFFGPMFICGLVLGVVLWWAVASLLYRLILTSSVLKGVWVAALQLLLHGLFAALVAGVAFTALAVWQLLGHPPPFSNAPPPPTAVHVAPAAVDRS